MSVKRFTPGFLCLVGLSACGSLQFGNESQDRFLQPQPELVQEEKQFIPAEDCGGDLTTEQRMYLELVYKMEKQGQYYAALAHIDELEKKAESPQTFYLRAEALRQLGELTAAEKFYQLLLGGCMTGYGLHGLGLLATENGRLDEAETYLKHACRERPVDADVHNDYGMVLLFRGRHDAARKEFLTALQLDKENRLPVNNLIVLMLLENRPIEAKRFAEKEELKDDEFQHLKQRAERLKRQLIANDKSKVEHNTQNAEHSDVGEQLTTETSAPIVNTLTPDNAAKGSVPNAEQSQSDTDLSTLDREGGKNALENVEPPLSDQDGTPGNADVADIDNLAGDDILPSGDKASDSGLQQAADSQSPTNALPVANDSALGDATPANQDFPADTQLETEQPLSSSDDQAPKDSGSFDKANSLPEDALTISDQQSVDPQSPTGDSPAAGDLPLGDPTPTDQDFPIDTKLETEQPLSTSEDQAPKDSNSFNTANSLPEDALTNNDQQSVDPQLPTSDSPAAADLPISADVPTEQSLPGGGAKPEAERTLSSSNDETKKNSETEDNANPTLNGDIHPNHRQQNVLQANDKPQPEANLPSAQIPQAEGNLATDEQETGVSLPNNANP